ncbi:MAG: enoyl-CoA hydratase-related protein [candidate division WOR-3 bacterium]|nr:enoyl-CoA hydratase-related protein [candidate division WOR-3 bacterium]
MAYKNIIVEITDKIAVLKVNRPEVLNAVNTESLLEIESAMKEFNDNKDVRVIIITGEGKSFVSGSDISRLAQMDSLAAREYSQIGQRVLSFIENMEKPVIAAVNGYALGSGCEIAMACDIRIASEKAKFGQPEVKLGLIPGHAGTQRLARLVGIGKAKELIFTGDMIDAQEAYNIGLVNKVVPAENLLEEAKNLAKKIIENAGPNAVRIAKTVINRGIDANLLTANSYETEAFSILFSTEEAKEGMKAFLEKRKPQW